MTDRVEKHSTSCGTLRDLKRCYLPFTVHSKCPDCGKEWQRDLSSDYLGYPNTSGPAPVQFHCEDDGGDCDGEWSVMVEIAISLKLATGARVA